MSSGRYDNWYIRHTLPQSDLQYRWIDDSYNDDKNQPFGFTGLTHDGGGLVPFTIPSASTSMTQSSPTFLSESLTGAFGLNVDFVGLNSLIYSPITASTNTYGYPLSRPLASYAGSVLPLSSDLLFNSYMLNINGPYQYPTWKQIRGDSSPVVRFHKRNNILSVTKKPLPITLPNGNGPGIPATYTNYRDDSFRNYTEPSITFKYKPLLQRS